jgi:peptidoglycan/LPS O-acetylase OafA/YrhL
VIAQLLGPHALERPFDVVAINFTMLQGFLYVPAVDGAYWSLTVELAFYVCMWGLWRLRLLGRIELVLIAWIALRCVWWLLPEASSLLGKLLLVDYIAFFAIGIAAYRVRQGVRRWAQQAPLLLAGLATTALIDSLAETLVYLCTLGVFIALIGHRLRLLDRPGLLWLGALSYPLYLIHQFIGYAFIASLEASGVPAWLATAIAVVAVLALAHAIHQWVEKPAQRLLRALRKPRREHAAA